MICQVGFSENENPSQPVPEQLFVLVYLGSTHEWKTRYFFYGRWTLHTLVFQMNM